MNNEQIHPLNGTEQTEVVWNHCPPLCVAPSSRKITLFTPSKTVSRVICTVNEIRTEATHVIVQQTLRTSL